jgi:hypothetical protein
VPGQVLAVIGIGSLRCAPAIIGSLAGYFGERDLEVRLYDADPERLDLFDRLTRFAFAYEESKHELVSIESPAEALEGADLALVAVGENCSRYLLRGKRGHEVLEPEERVELVTEAVNRLLSDAEEHTTFLSLMRGMKGAQVAKRGGAWRALEWPARIKAEERLGKAHQLLRWLNGSEPIGELIDSYQHSPIRRWLDAPGCEL